MHACVTPQATPGHIWTGRGQPCSDLFTSGADTLRGSEGGGGMNNTHTCTVCPSWEVHKRRQACTPARTNIQRHTCVVGVYVCVCLNAHASNHTHTQTRCSWTILPSCEPAFLFYAWKEVCVLSHCLRQKYEQSLQLFEEHVNLPEEPNNSAGLKIKPSEPILK